MIVLSQKFVGTPIECPNCYALLAYKLNDVYQNKYVYCPLCRTKILTNLDLSYDGVVEVKK